MLYDRENAPGEVKLRFHIRDKFGEDIFHSLRYDPDTGYGVRRNPRTNSEEQYFKPGGYVEIDGIVNPTAEQLSAIYASIRSHLSGEVMATVATKVIEDSRNV